MLCHCCLFDVIVSLLLCECYVFGMWFVFYRYVIVIGMLVVGYVIVVLLFC